MTCIIRHNESQWIELTLSTLLFSSWCYKMTKNIFYLETRQNREKRCKSILLIHSIVLLLLFTKLVFYRLHVNHISNQTWTHHHFIHDDTVNSIDSCLPITIKLISILQFIFKNWIIFVVNSIFMQTNLTLSIID